MNRCKGFCDRFSVSRPKHLVFLTVSRCRVCEKYFEKSYNRCPCCGARLATRPRLNTNKKKYIPLRLNKYNEMP